MSRASLICWLGLLLGGCDSEQPKIVDNDGDGFDTEVDCSDGDPAIYPGAVEVPADGVDQNCDGVDHCYYDGDGDGHGGADSFAGDNMDCTDRAGESKNDNDCDDSHNYISPDGAEIAGNGIDEDCDGVLLCWVDRDGDGFGGTQTVEGQANDSDCSDGPREAANSDDCDDDDPLVHPRGAEAVGDGVDGDCDGIELCFEDLDHDGFGTDVVTQIIAGDCDAVLGSAARDRDCNDENGAIYPGQERHLPVPTVYATIQSAIDAACDSDIVELSAQTFYERPVLTDKRITVVGQAESWGPTTTINGNGGAAFAMDSGTLKNVVLTNGTADSGAGLLLDGASGVVLDNLQFSNNFATNGAGCLHITESTDVEATNLTFSGCRSQGQGGSVAIIDSNDITITDAVGQDNYGDRGAASFYVYNSHGLDLENVSSVGDQSAGAVSGYIFSESSGDIELIGALAPISGGHAIQFVDSDFQVHGYGTILGPAAGVQVVSSGGHLVELWNGLVMAMQGTGFTVDVSSAGDVVIGNTLFLQLAGHGVLSVGSAAPDVRYCNFWDIGLSELAGMATPATSHWNLGANPMLVRYHPNLSDSEWEMHLLPGSALRGAGDPAITNPDNSRSDIGIYGGNSDFEWEYYEDFDADGMYDGWEMENGLNVTVDDSGDDGDTDNLSNLTEFLGGTRPNRADTDGDGVNDDTELTSQTHPLDPLDY